MPNPAPYLAWIDLETTGSDPTQDPILEVAIILTKASAPYVELMRGSWVIRPDHPGWTHRFDPVVLRMHVDNGLLADVFNHGSALPIVEAEIAEHLSQHGRRHDFLIAGSGVAHFDRAVIAHQMPKLHKWLRYNSLDVGVLRRTLSTVSPIHAEWVAEAEETGGAIPHRALGDILRHIEEMRFYARQLGAPARG